LVNLSAGTYIFVLQSTGAATGGTSSLTLWPEATAVVPVDGASVALTGVTGQNGRYTFAGTAGDFLAFAVTQLSTTPANTNVTFQVLTSDGAVLATCIFISPSSCALPVLLATGTYSIRVIPDGTASFATTVLLSKAISGTLVVDGAALQFSSSRPGLVARYSLAATAGQHLTVEWQGQPSWPNQLSLTIFGPIGNTVSFVTRGTSSIPSWDSTIDLANLTAGNYTFVFQSAGVATGSTASLSAATFGSAQNILPGSVPGKPAASPAKSRPAAKPTLSEADAVTTSARASRQ
jgi:hypothetical protein